MSILQKNSFVPTKVQYRIKVRSSIQAVGKTLATAACLFALTVTG